jgi:hypothetical protein
MMNKGIRKVGVAYGSHTKVNHMCVIDYATELLDINDDDMGSVQSLSLNLN